MASSKTKKIEEKSRLIFTVRLVNAMPMQVRTFFQNLRTRWEMNRITVGRVLLFVFEFSLYGIMVMLALHMIGFPISLGAFLGSGSAYYVLTDLFGEWHKSKRG